MRNFFTVSCLVKIRPTKFKSMSKSKLLIGCKSFTLTSSEEPSVIKLALRIDEEKGIKLLNSTSHVNNVRVTASNQKHVSSSNCHIASLEVYRGREQVIEISHSGFFLTKRGNLEVSIHSSSHQSAFRMIHINLPISEQVLEWVPLDLGLVVEIN